jgi:hypothetical protein
MCYFLYLASPLTLSEIRAMLPPGASADLASPAEQRLLKLLHAPTKTVAKVLVGRCSCDLVRPRLADIRDDERHLRERYRSMQLPRTTVIQLLARHRRQGAPIAPPQSGWAAALGGFVSEHSRNAGASLFFLHFGPSELPEVGLNPRRQQTPGQVRLDPAGWLKEGTPILVRRD